MIVTEGPTGRTRTVAAPASIMTVTVMVMDDSILLSAIKVARNFELSGLRLVKKPTGPVASVNTEIDRVEDWTGLIADGSVTRLKISLAQINQAFAESGEPLALKFPEEGDADEVFIELYAAVASIPSIGRSLLGEHEYRSDGTTSQSRKQR